MTAFLSIENVDKRFMGNASSAKVLDNVCLRVEKGQFVSIIGQSGCGKSTLLNIVVDLANATSGGVLLDGHEVNAPGPDRAVVFQNHSLLPWLSPYDNIRLAVDKVFGKTATRAKRHEWTMHNLELMQMAHARDKKLGEISGGMKQRIGIARALAMQPKVLLLDEPFGAPDALTRAHLQDQVTALQERLGNTVMMIPRDVDEAVLLSDRNVMMTNGPQATIGEVLEAPLTRSRDRIALAKDQTYLASRQCLLQFLYERHR